MLQFFVIIFLDLWPPETKVVEMYGDLYAQLAPRWKIDCDSSQSIWNREIPFVIKTLWLG